MRENQSLLPALHLLRHSDQRNGITLKEVPSLRSTVIIECLLHVSLKSCNYLFPGTVSAFYFVPVVE